MEGVRDLYEKYIIPLTKDVEVGVPDFSEYSIKSHVSLSGGLPLAASGWSLQGRNWGTGKEVKRFRRYVSFNTYFPDVLVLCCHHVRLLIAYLFAWVVGLKNLSVGSRRNNSQFLMMQLCDNQCWRLFFFSAPHINITSIYFPFSLLRYHSLMFYHLLHRDLWHELVPVLVAQCLWHKTGPDFKNTTCAYYRLLRWLSTNKSAKDQSYHFM